MTTLSQCSEEVVGSLLERIARGEYTLDICHMGDSIQNVKNLGGREKSSSPTTVLFADIVRRSRLSLGESRSCVIPSVLKITIDPKDISPVLGEYGQESFLSLIYEQKVYEKVLQKCLANKYSPNFVGFLAAGKCSWDNLRDSFLTQYRTFLSDIMCQRRKTVASARIGEADVKCKKVVDDLVSLITEGEMKEGDPKKISLYILATEKKGQISLGQYMKDIESENDRFPFDDRLSEKEKVMDEFLQIMFQICYNLKLMETLSLSHNDLHTGNIRIELLKDPRTLYYEYNGMYFKIRTRHVVYFYDWDNAYEASIMGKNPIINDTTPYYYSYRGDKFTRGFDYQSFIQSVAVSCPDFFNLFLQPFIKIFSEEANKIETLSGKRYMEREKKGVRQHGINGSLDIASNLSNDKIGLPISKEDWEKIYSSERGHIASFGKAKRYRLYRKYIRNFPSLNYLYEGGISEILVDLTPDSKREIFLVNKSWDWHPSAVFLFDFDQICSLIFGDFEVDRAEAMGSKELYSIPEIKVRRGESYISDVFGDL